MNTKGSHDTLQDLDQYDSAFMLCLLRQELDQCDDYNPCLRLTAEDLRLIRQSIVAEIAEIEESLNRGG